MPAASAALTLSLPYNDLSGVEAAFRERPASIAAVIVEPVAGNMGVVPPAPGFLPGLRDLCTRFGALLVFCFDYADNPEAWHTSMRLLAEEVLPRCADLVPREAAAV